METIELKQLYDNYDSAMEMTNSIDADYGMIKGFRTALLTLQRLWEYPDEEWVKIRNRIHVGITPRAGSLGNTSVSMGIVSGMATQSVRGAVNMINYGTGGAKYQRYVINKFGIVTLDREVKSKQITPLIDTLDSKGEIDYEAAEELRRELESFSIFRPWDHDEHSYVFITGKFRKAYYELNKTKQKEVDKMLKTVFDPFTVPWDFTYGYCIPQELEGKMELKAVKTLYRNTDAKTKDCQRLVPVASFGIGRGSTQFMVDNNNNDPITGSMHPYGMSNSMDELTEVAYDIPFQVVTELISTCISLFNRGKVPVLAMKSGCTLLIDNYPEVKKVLQRPVKQSE